MSLARKSACLGADSAQVTPTMNSRLRISPMARNTWRGLATYFETSHANPPVIASSTASIIGTGIGCEGVSPPTSGTASKIHPARSAVSRTVRESAPQLATAKSRCKTVLGRVESLAVTGFEAVRVAGEVAGFMTVLLFHMEYNVKAACSCGTTAAKARRTDLPG